MNRALKIISLAVGLGLIASVSTFAGPPFLTDDPEPVDYQNWEFYIASQHTETADGWSGTAPHIELNYGVITNVQLHLIAPLAYNVPSEGGTHYGYGDTELGVKYRLLDETTNCPMIGVFPLLEVPTGDADRDSPRSLLAGMRPCRRPSSESS